MFFESFTNEIIYLQEQSVVFNVVLKIVLLFILFWLFSLLFDNME